MTYYEQIGGEPAVRLLVERFYTLMDVLPEAKAVRDLHASSLASSKEKLFKFLSGWLGGPSLYIQEYGHPRLRMRHFPFAIGEAERDQWMMCMGQALDELDIPGNVREELLAKFAALADHMRNQES